MIDGSRAECLGENTLRAIQILFCFLPLHLTVKQGCFGQSSGFDVTSFEYVVELGHIADGLLRW